MQIYYQDFVDRKDQLNDLHKAVEQLNHRIVIIQGRPGIGKSLLINEFLAEVRSPQLQVVLIDLQRTFTERNFLSFILEFPNQSSEDYFKGLYRALQEARSFIPGAGGVEQGGETVSRGSAAAGGSGMQFSGTVIAPGGQFAGRDIVNYFIQANSDPYERELIQANITKAFHDDLLATTKDCPMVLAFDHWDSANLETKDWLRRNLLEWSLNHMPRMIILVVCRDRPDWYQNRIDINTIELIELPVEAVREYWEKQKLPTAMLEGYLSLCIVPKLLVMVAEEMTRRLKLSPGGGLV